MPDAESTCGPDGSALLLCFASARRLVIGRHCRNHQRLSADGRVYSPRKCEMHATEGTEEDGRDTNTTRNPLLLLRSAGSLWLRYAERAWF